MTDRRGDRRENDTHCKCTCTAVIASKHVWMSSCPTATLASRTYAHVCSVWQRHQACNATGNCACVHACTCTQTHACACARTHTRHTQVQVAATAAHSVPLVDGSGIATVPAVPVGAGEPTSAQHDTAHKEMQSTHLEFLHTLHALCSTLPATWHTVRACMARSDTRVQYCECAHTGVQSQQKLQACRMHVGSCCTQRTDYSFQKNSYVQKNAAAKHACPASSTQPMSEPLQYTG
jgi:hypothetical protein